jgi:VIT1/CCC1 family predicted Fe2+/Mn2+ transporter
MTSTATGPPASAFGKDLREDARTHIRDHARREAARIERRSRVREFVLGAQDGLLVPLGVVTGMAAASPGRSAILVAGIAEAVAGCIAMGGGSYLASEAEEGLYAAEIADERREIDEHPDREVAELALVLEDEGLAPAVSERVARGLATNPSVFLRTKVQKELGLSPDAGGAALGDALVVGLTYVAAAVVPLWPYALLPLMAPALLTSIICTLLALFGVGVAKGRVARQAWRRAGLQVMLIGSVSASVGFAIGHLVTAITS